MEMPQAFTMAAIGTSLEIVAASIQKRTPSSIVTLPDSWKSLFLSPTSPAFNAQNGS
jgi:hypothetical protein